MIVYGFDSIAPLLENDGYLFKLLANDTGVVLFPHTAEHRDATQPGIKYADDSRGNALAAIDATVTYQARTLIHGAD